MNVDLQRNCPTIALICAAGFGTRVGGELPKQYQILGQKPMMVHTLEAFIHNECISSVYVVIAPNDEWYDERVKPYLTKDVCVLRVGGATRAESVCHALTELDAEYETAYVMVHDAARPCITTDLIRNLHNAVLAQEGDAGGLLVLPVVDTVKLSDNGMHIKKTIDRKKLFLAQTPQMFRLNLLLNAWADALIDTSSLMLTDDASAMERAGYDPLLVMGHARNLKVTYADDFKLAQFWLNQE